MAELTIHFGDNLPVLRGLPADSVDLLYMDSAPGARTGGGSCQHGGGACGKEEHAEPRRVVS